jgi:hypothetical protein
MYPMYRVGPKALPTLQDAAGAQTELAANPSHQLIRRPGTAKHTALYAARSKALVRTRGDHRRPSLLCGVEAASPEMADALVERLPKCAGEDRIRDLSAFAQTATDALRGHIEANWDSGAKHVVMHSSGFDSRLLSVLLRSLVDEHGMAWLGDTRFVCFEPEVAYAHRLYQHVGWPEAMWYPIRGTAVDYYAKCLDFATLGRELSEASRFWGGPLLAQLALTADGFLGDGPVQGLTALFSDETIKWNRLRWGTLAWFVGCFFFDNPGVFPGRPDIHFLTPFVSQGWLDLLCQYRMPELATYPIAIQEYLRKACAHPGAIDAMKQVLLRHLDPALAVLPNFRFQVRAIRERNDGHIDQQKISDATAQAMESSYRESWYARTHGPVTLDYQNERSFVYFSDRNTHYMKAAIYEPMFG